MLKIGKVDDVVQDVAYAYPIKNPTGIVQWDDGGLMCGMRYSSIIPHSGFKAGFLKNPK